LTWLLRETIDAAAILAFPPRTCNIFSRATVRRKAQPENRFARHEPDSSLPH
jgi:hypothetical protein